MSLSGPRFFSKNNAEKSGKYTNTLIFHKILISFLLPVNFFSVLTRVEVCKKEWYKCNFGIISEFSIAPEGNLKQLL